MEKQTIVIKKQNNMYGGYQYVEFSTESKEYTSGNSSAHVGHGNSLLQIEVPTLKELTKQMDSLSIQGYTKIESFEKVADDKSNELFNILYVVTYDGIDGESYRTVIKEKSSYHALAKVSGNVNGNQNFGMNFKVDVHPTI